jgi:hypothetical protein
VSIEPTFAVIEAKLATQRQADELNAALKPRTDGD